jgi:lycopene cyclase domain-containing protein
MIIGSFILERINLGNLVSFILGITIIGSIWDIWATKHGKRDRVWLWQFNYADMLGVRFFGLPIEEYLFYVSTSAYIIFIWEGIRLASESRDPQIFNILGIVGVWSLVFIVLPYLIRPKKDKIR